MRMTVATAVACLLGVGISTAHDAQAAIRKETTISAQGLGPALKQLANERDIQLVYRSEVVGNRQTSGAVGELTVDQALTRLLKGTGLTYEYIDDRAITIVPMQETAATRGVTNRRSLSSGVWDRFRVAQVDQGNTAGDGGAEKSNVAADERPASIEEIIVTAQKRQERAQDVPTSMQVLSASRLEAQGVTQLSQYAKQVPGLRIVGDGGPGQGKPILRGISTGVERTGVVGLFLDDVPFSPSSTRSLNLQSYSFDPSLADIEQIEVIKGPQSTLYGANALSGIIKFVSKRPDLENFDSSVRLEGLAINDGGVGYNARASFNIPVVSDRIGVRASGFYRKEPGYVDNLYWGEEEINESTVKGGRVTILGKISENVETTVSALVQKIDSEGLFSVAVNPQTLQPEFGDLAYSSPIVLPSRAEYRSLSDNLVVTLPFGTLTNILSYADFKADSNVDISNNMFPFFGAPAGTGAVARGLAESERISNELRLASNPGKIEWLLGLFYTEEDATNRSVFRATDTAGQIVSPTLPYFNVYTFATDATFDEMAAFGNLTYNFSDKLEATVGMRYSKNEQDYHSTSSGLFTFGFPLDIGYPTEDSTKNYLFTVSYKPMDNLTVYARAADAYRPGGANVFTQQQLDLGAPRAFSSDHLWNYEVGMKGSVGAGLMNYSLAAFRMKWTDMQIATTISNFNVTGNIGKAQSDGIEASLEFNPVDGLNLSLAAAYIEAEIGDDPTAARTLGPGAVEGNSLPYSPKFSGSALVDYRKPLSNDMAVTAGLTYAYYSEQKPGFSASLAPITLPTYGTLDLRAGLDWRQMSLIARVDNATDKYAVTSIASNWGGVTGGGPFFATVIRPRTYSLSLEARF